MDLQTRWITFEDAFTKKRFMHLLVQLESEGESDDLYMNVYFDYDTINSTSRNVSHQINEDLSLALWDDALWDSAIWGGIAELQWRLRIGRTGTAVLARFRHYVPNSGVSILKTGVSAETLSDRLG